jgi:hypothetical protein
MKPESRLGTELPWGRAVNASTPPMRLLLQTSLVLAACLLTVPSGRGHSKAPHHFADCVSQTGRTATLIVPATSPLMLGERPIEAGDELAVFTPSGLCAGAAVWTGESLALAIWEEDLEAETRTGFAPGTPLTFRAWRAAANEEFTVADVKYHRDYETSGTFASDAVFLVDGIAFAGGTGVESGEPLAFELAPAYPNPFHARTTLAYTLPEGTDARLEVFDLLGRRVAVLVDERLQAGRYEATFHAESGLAAGVYVGRLVAGAHTALARFTYVP